MKNVFRFSMLVIFLTTSLRSGAAENFDVKVSGNQLLLVELQNVEQGSILSFRDNYGEILFRDSLFLNEPYRKNLSLEVVPDGVYYLNLDLANRIITTVIVKNDRGLEISGNTSKTVFKPLFKIEGKTVKMLLTNPEEKKVFFRIYDSKGTLLETVSCADPIIKRTLDFSRIPSGEYTIKVQLGDHFFNRKINVG